MEPKRDLYEVLGVSKEADANQIKDAFRELALRYHPDRNKEPGAEERFKEIAGAYAVLSDPEKRQQYDTRGFEGVVDFSPEDLFGGINFEEIFGNFGSSSLFDKFFGRHKVRQNRGADVEVYFDVSLDKIMFGGSVPITLLVKDSCSNCKGSGAVPGTQPKTCDECHGTGETIITSSEKNVLIKNITTCFKCHGKGVLIEKPCPQCGGTGMTRKEKKIEVSIPKGIEDGTILKVQGHGAMAPTSAGVPGDLLVIVRTQEDPRFQRAGPDLYCAVTIPVYDAVLGTKIEVQTLDGKIVVNVPKGTQSQTTLRVTGKGLPKFNQTGFGDLYEELKKIATGR
ncbi:MAG: DnaJ C-terminal domain-containing protein [Bacteriovorax sp.]|nr:DnaJ C-terminal domain-containing protein [Bacteriovorax sp.]